MFGVRRQPSHPLLHALVERFCKDLIVAASVDPTRTWRVASHLQTTRNRGAPRCVSRVTSRASIVHLVTVFEKGDEAVADHHHKDGGE